jgi:hypothetical protein
MLRLTLIAKIDMMFSALHFPLVRLFDTAE